MCMCRYCIGVPWYVFVCTYAYAYVRVCIYFEGCVFSVCVHAPSMCIVYAYYVHVYAHVHQNGDMFIEPVDNDSITGMDRGARGGLSYCWHRKVLFTQTGNARRFI